MNAVWRMGTEFDWVGTHVNGAEFQGKFKLSPSPFSLNPGGARERERITDRLSMILPLRIRLWQYTARKNKSFFVCEHSIDFLL